MPFGQEKKTMREKKKLLRGKNASADFFGRKNQIPEKASRAVPHELCSKVESALPWHYPWSLTKINILKQLHFFSNPGLEWFSGNLFITQHNFLSPHTRVCHCAGDAILKFLIPEMTFTLLWRTQEWDMFFYCDEIRIYLLSAPLRYKWVYFP